MARSTGKRASRQKASQAYAPKRQANGMRRCIDANFELLASGKGGIKSFDVRKGILEGNETLSKIIDLQSEMGAITHPDRRQNLQNGVVTLLKNAKGDDGRTLELFDELLSRHIPHRHNPIETDIGRPSMQDDQPTAGEHITLDASEDESTSTRVSPPKRKRTLDDVETRVSTQNTDLSTRRERRYPSEGETIDTPTSPQPAYRPTEELAETKARLEEVQARLDNAESVIEARTNALRQMETRLNAQTRANEHTTRFQGDFCTINVQPISTTFNGEHTRPTNINRTSYMDSGTQTTLSTQPAIIKSQRRLDRLNAELWVKRAQRRLAELQGNDSIDQIDADRERSQRFDAEMLSYQRALERDRPLPQHGRNDS